MKIVICEDDNLILEHINKTISNYAMINDWNFEVALADTNPDIILDYARKNKNIDCYFLDIDLGKDKQTGIDLGKKIRDIDPFAKLIYVTGYDDMRINVLDAMIAPFAYIIKDKNMDTKLRVVLDKVYNQYLISTKQNVNINKISIKVGNTYRILDISNILFFETFGDHKLQLTTNDNTIQFYGKLAEIEKLHDSLFDCHRSFLVNINNIENFDKENITFKNGESYQFPSSSIKKIKNELKRKK